MPKITFNKQALLKNIGKKLSDEQLADRMAMLGTDVESITKNEIEVEVFPNRPDLLSEQGFARALKTFLGTKKGLSNYTIKKSNYQVIVDKNVTMRPYSVCAVVKGIHFTDERIRDIMQLQEKLALTHGRNRKKSCYGLYPLEHIHFPICYIAKDPKTITFQPLGMNKPIRADQVEQQHKTGKQYCHIAKDWKLYPFYIDTKNNVLSMLPYTNSEDTGKITTTTKDVFIECTGTDMNNVQQALNILTTTLADMGGTLYNVTMNYPGKTFTTPQLTPTTMNINITSVNKLLGLHLKETDMKKLLEKMGYGYNNHKAHVPAYRTDIIHEQDIIEDIAIAYGYENFPTIIPNIATTAQEAPQTIFKEKITELLIGLELLETSTYHLSNQATQTTKINSNQQPIPLEDTKSEDYNVLRNNILANLLEVLGKNTHHTYPQNLYEMGTIFNPGNTETGIQETEHLAITLCGEGADYTKIKQLSDYLTQQLGMTITYEEPQQPSEVFIKGRKATLNHQGKMFGIIGELHPEILHNFNITMPTAALELNLDMLYHLITQGK
ncbi:MAG TPA: phenylalanine--tRNA ligase subunit beta [Candidatus Nanoarchaeia archaeon]|nr:phenylalanine--tRNA ligase subunit beta [Candidatus Nanoarchaeia archaeon]